LIANNSKRRFVNGIELGSMLAVLILGLLTSVDARSQAVPGQVESNRAPASRKTAQEVLALVNEYCASCHAVPRPDVLPRRSWPAVIRTMVEISQERRGRAFISKEQMNDIIAFYYGSSPEELPILPRIEKDASAQFARTEIGSRTQLPYITSIEAVRSLRGSGVELLVSDGEARKLFSLNRIGNAWKEAPLADIEIPVHAQVIDFDDDGDLDILVADLGQFPPLDALAGKLFLLRQTASGAFNKELLQDNLGRVSDARALDLDADGDLDIVIAVFGGGNVGEVFWLENTSDHQGAAKYQKHSLLELSGAITVSPADLNGDGKMDLVTLVAQEHEMIVAFVNQGSGQFAKSIIARAPHPMYGSTSLSTVDLDRDGDIDVLFTNGDAFDAQTDPKPYHGLQWLENTGQLQFAFHSIGRFYGASAAAAGDLDGDGDLDIVATSWVNFWTDAGRAALVWYENDGKQSFTPRTIATRPAGLTSIQLVDVTGDGALDVIAGAIRMDLLLAKLGSNYKASRLFPPSEAGATHPRVILFENKIK
jgi:hypothetical protein